MSSSARMHADELDIDGELVRRLIGEQFPHWAGLPVTRVASAGTDNAMYRLGGDMVVRLPRLPGGEGQIGTEQRWLPRLAPYLPLTVPVPLALGEPGCGYGLRWGVYGWLDGSNAYDSPPAELTSTAVELGRFVAALRQVDAVGGPVSFRGGPVGEQDAEVRKAIEDLGADGTHDAALATAAWEHALALPRGRPPPSGSTATSSPATSSPPAAGSPRSSTSAASGPATRRRTRCPRGPCSRPGHVNSSARRASSRTRCGPGGGDGRCASGWWRSTTTGVGGTRCWRRWGIGRWRKR